MKSYPTIPGFKVDVEPGQAGSFQTFLRLVTPIQTRVLYAIASEGSIKEIQGKAFLTKYQLGAASTVKTSVKSLVEKELLLDNNGEYQLYDRFFGLWLVENVR